MSAHSAAVVLKATYGSRRKSCLKRGGDAELRDYQLNEDLAAQDGLVCGGTMYFLIDPVRETDPYRDFAAQAVDAYAGGPPMAIVNITAAPSNAKVVVGAKMLVRENGETQGKLSVTKYSKR